MQYKNTSVSAFRRNAMLKFAAGFFLRYVHAADAADHRFFMHGVFRSQTVPV